MTMAVVIGETDFFNIFKRSGILYEVSYEGEAVKMRV
jgi:hypothetical protein